MLTLDSGKLGHPFWVPGLRSLVFCMEVLVVVVTNVSGSTVVSRECSRVIGTQPQDLPHSCFPEAAPQCPFTFSDQLCAFALNSDWFCTALVLAVTLEARQLSKGLGGKACIGV